MFFQNDEVVEVQFLLAVRLRILEKLRLFLPMNSFLDSQIYFFGVFEEKNLVTGNFHGSLTDVQQNRHAFRDAKRRFFKFNFV